MKWPHLATRRGGYDGLMWPHLAERVRSCCDHVLGGLMVRSRVELFAAIRRGERVEGLSVRALADRYGVHRRTVRQALASSLPPERKVAVRAAPKLDPVKPVIDAMLRADLEAPKKQRHTARRVLARLVDEHGFAELSYSAVRDYVRARRPQVAAESGRAAEQAFVPQTHEPGAEAEVDFADLWVDLGGVRTKVHLFTLRLSYSGWAVHRVFASQGQEAFLEGHVYAFEAMGGVPAVHIRYDNLKSAVTRVCFGRSRVESDRWVAFRSHYGFEAFYCQPGKDGAHEKGGVEGEGGRFRRNHLVPVPKVGTLAELNARLAGADAGDEARRIGNRVMPVGHDFVLEQRMLTPLPGEPFATAVTLRPRVDRYGRVTVRQCLYSVPARLTGTGCGWRCARMSWPCSTGEPRWLATGGRRHGARRAWCWITISRCWPVNPGRCPERRRWPRRARPGCSPPNTTRCGPRPARRMETRPAPGC